MLYGAILGDIIGSVYEFDNGDKSRDFPLFSDWSRFTDDTVMTIAVADALLQYDKAQSIDYQSANYKEILIDSMKKWGKKYPNAGYGYRFFNWVLGEDRKPYGSWGNGSAMRVSPVAWTFVPWAVNGYYLFAQWTAEVTHNHSEGIKGATSLVAAIQYARMKKTKDEIKELLEGFYHYDLSKTLDEIRPTYRHVEDCMNTMPAAFECFLESEDYESCIRNVMYIGGDTDTLGAIAGAVAEAYYGIPDELIKECRKRLPSEMLEIIDEFEKYFYEKNKEAIEHV